MNLVKKIIVRLQELSHSLILLCLQTLFDICFVAVEALTGIQSKYFKIRYRA